MKTIEETIGNMEFNTTTSAAQRKILIDIAEAEGEYTKTNTELAAMIGRGKLDMRHTLQQMEKRKLIKRQTFHDDKGTIEKRVLSLHPDFVYRLSKEREKGVEE